VSNPQEVAMGFDLWSTLGVSPRAGIAAALGGLALAVLIGVRVFWRNRSDSRTPRGLSLND
jgi:hypothetical protein